MLTDCKHFKNFKAQKHERFYNLSIELKKKKMFCKKSFFFVCFFFFFFHKLYIPSLGEGAER